MPTYTYRREDGSTFDYRQSFNDTPLTVDPNTGQSVVRVVQAAGIIFKGSGFYVNDSRGKDTTSINSTATKTDTAKTDDAKPAKVKTETHTSKADANAAAD